MKCRDQNWATTSFSSRGENSSSPFLLIAAPNQVLEISKRWFRDSPLHHIEDPGKASSYDFVQGIKTTLAITTKSCSTDCVFAIVHRQHVVQLRTTGQVVYSQGCIFHLLVFGNTQNTPIERTKSQWKMQQYEMLSKNLSQSFCDLMVYRGSSPYYINSEGVRGDN